MPSREPPLRAHRARCAGSVTPPADKSISHRAALFGAMSDEPGDDQELPLRGGHALHARRRCACSARASTCSEGELVVRGVGLRGALEATGGTLDVGNSGTLLRLLPGWLAGQPGGVWTLDGDESIRRRPVDRVVEPLAQMGASVEAREGRLPAAADRRRRAHRHRLRAAGGERAGQVVRADRGPARRGGDARRASRTRAATTPSASCSARTRAVRARDDGCAVRLAARRARARRGRPCRATRRRRRSGSRRPRSSRTRGS